MKNAIKSRINPTRAALMRWGLILLGACLAALLAATFETGKANAQIVGFRFLGALVRVITPNGDGLNDVAILCTDNPKDSDVSGTIYDLRGRFVASMTRVQGGPTVANCPPPSSAVPQPEAMTWDGRSGGALVTGGVYVYQLQSEGVTVTGTLVVVR